MRSCAVKTQQKKKATASVANDHAGVFLPSISFSFSYPIPFLALIRLFLGLDFYLIQFHIYHNSDFFYIIL